MRVVSAILGIFTVVAAYLLAQRMFNARVALLTCGWLTISLWHVIFSRIGLRSISLPLFLAVGFYCVWRGLEGISSQAGSRRDSPLPSPRSAMWFALGGMVIGLSQYTYSTARFAPFVIIALAMYLAFLHRRLLRQALPGLILSLAVATIVFLPEGLFFLNDRASFLSRPDKSGYSIQSYMRAIPYGNYWLQQFALWNVRDTGRWRLVLQHPRPANIRSLVSAADVDRNSFGPAAVPATGIWLHSHVVDRDVRAEPPRRPRDSKSPQGHRDYPGHLHLAGNRRHLALGSLGVARAEETTVPTGLARDAGISSWNIPYVSKLFRTVGETSRTHRCFQWGPDGYSSGCPQDGKCRLEDDFRGWWRLL